MSDTSSTTVRLHGFEKTWSHSYKVETYRFHLNLLHTRDALYMQGLITLESGLYLDDHASVRILDTQNQLLVEADISELGRFTLLAPWKDEYLVHLAVDDKSYFVDKLIIT